MNFQFSFRFACASNSKPRERTSPSCVWTVVGEVVPETTFFFFRSKTDAVNRPENQVGAHFTPASYWMPVSGLNGVRPMVWNAAFWMLLACTSGLNTLAMLTYGTTPFANS